MVHTEALTPTIENTYSMEDQWLWYLAGSIDSNATIRVQVEKASSMKLGYKLSPMIFYSRPQSVEPVMGMIDEYAENEGIQYRLSEIKNSFRLEIDHIESIRRFLNPLIGGFVQQRERAEFFLDEVLPMLETNPQTKSEFIEVIKKIGTMRQFPIQPKSTKYTWTYFKKEWGDEISQ